MRIRQYVTFTLFSGSMTPAEITARLMVEPDKIRTRGSRQAAPPGPAHHAWEIVCDHRSLTVGEQVRQVIDRLRPHQDAVAQLVREPAADCTAQLNVVRYLGDEDGEEEERSLPDSRLQKISGQHQLLGWHLDRGTIVFLAAVHAESMSTSTADSPCPLRARPTGRNCWYSAVGRTTATTSPSRG